MNLKKKFYYKLSDYTGLLQTVPASYFDVSVVDEAEVVVLNDGDRRGVEGAEVVSNVIVFNSNL